MASDHQVFERRMKQLCCAAGGANKVAERIGCHPNTLYRIYSTNGYPSAPQLIAIARKYGTDLNWLLAVDNDELKKQ